ncbi:hypothetical protein EJB05_49377, partial [Eragrostis curvula]
MDLYAARLDAARRGTAVDPAGPASGGRVERAWGPPSGGGAGQLLRPPHGADDGRGCAGSGRGCLRQERQAAADSGGNATGAASGGNAADGCGRGKAEQDKGGDWGWWWRGHAVARRGVPGQSAGAGAGGSSADGAALGVPGSVVAREVGTKRPLPPPPFAHHPPPKRTAVSAKRQFPPGCGRDAAAPLGRADSSSPRFQAAARAGDSPETPHNAAAVSPCPPLAGRDDGDLNSGADSVVAKVSHVPAARLLAKRRMVSAHRSFPPGCGRPLLSVQVRLQLESGRDDGNRPEEIVADHGEISAAADEQGMEIDAAPPYIGRLLVESGRSGDGNRSEEMVADREISAAAVEQAMETVVTPYIGAATDDGAVQDEELEEGEIPPEKEHAVAEQHIIMGPQVSVNDALHKPVADCRHEASVPATDDVEASAVAEDFKVVNSPAGSSSCNVTVQSLSEDPSEEEDLRGKMLSEIPKTDESTVVAKDLKVINSSAWSSCNIAVQSLPEGPSEEDLKGKTVPEIPKMDESSVVAKDFKVMNSSAGSSCNVAVQSLAQGPSEEDLKGKRVPEIPKMDESSGVAARVPGEPAMRRKVMLTARKSVRPPKMIQKSAVGTQHAPFSKNKEEKSEPAGSKNEIEDTDEFTKDLVKQALLSSEKCPGTQGKEAATVKGYFGPRKKVKVNDPKSEIGRRVTRNVIKNDSDEFTMDVGKQAPMSSEKRPMTQGKEASTVRGYFGPRKVKVKVPANVPIKVNLSCKLGSRDKLGDKVASNLENDDILKGLAVREGKLEFYLKNSTSVPSMKCQRQHGVQNADARSKVKMMCRRFEAICRTIAQAVDQRSMKVKRIDIEADKAIKTLPDFIKHGPIVGEVPGVQVGDEFLYRVELAMVGLHRPYQGGIDSTKDRNGVLVAISVVASGGYPDERSSSGELVYTGSGGKHAGRNAGGDQKLERGNLALKNCISRKSPVRVIHGFKRQNIEEGSHSRAKEITTFTYDGLYHVVDCWREGHPGSEVFKYKLQRIPGQPELAHCRKKRIMS